jgi:PilZ domain-containing protein
MSAAALGTRSTGTPVREIAVRWIGPDGLLVETPGLVRQISADRQFTIELREPAPELPAVGRPIELELLAGQATHRFRGRRGTAHTAELLVVRLIDPPGRAQRRRYRRAQVKLQAVLFQLDPDGQAVGHSPAQLIDLGAGGVRFVCQRELKSGEVVRLGFRPGVNAAISPSIEILECRPAEPARVNRGWTHLARGRFETISDDERHQVFQYVRELAQDAPA